MDIFDVAINMEVEGAAFYRELAKRANSEGLKTIFTMLAEDEDRHKEIFEAMKNETKVPVAAPDASERATKIFKQFKKDDFLRGEDELTAYEQALEIELKAIEYYTQQKESITDPKKLEIIDKIIEEERGHYDILDDIIVMVERPERWVEDAEFGVREEY
jgi:rubrerythrin